MGQGPPAQSNSPEERDAWGLDANGCAPDCPIRILGEQSGVSAPGYRANPSTKRNQHQNTTYGKYQDEYSVGERGYNDTGTAARFFAQFYPHDDPDQERDAMSTQLNQVLHGDCLEVLKTLEENSVDSICCDPPAGINFMNKAFDSNRGGRDAWVAWLTAIMREALRVLKPGGHAFVWALPRTSHWTALALEDSGFEIRDSIAHMFGCLSEDTEILTANGWEQYHTLKEGTRVLCYSVAHTLYWDEIQEVVSYDYDETAYHLHSDDTDQIVSRNHRCLVGEYPYSFELAENLPSEVAIPFIANAHRLIETEANISQPGWYVTSTQVQVTPVHYKGVVWCVRVPSGAFVARRNGKVFITGNSGFPKSANIHKAVEAEIIKQIQLQGVEFTGWEDE